MSVPDVLDLLSTQHEQIRRRTAEVRGAGSSDRKRLFADWTRLVYRHERADRAVVHPAARGCTPAGEEIGAACISEEHDIERGLARLLALGVDHADFPSGFAGLSGAVDAHLAHEEREEFPLMRRYVGAARLHRMAGQWQDFQVMDAY